MPRIGINPSRNQNVSYRPPRVTVAVLVYAPHQAGYFQHRMDVTRLTLESILTNTEKPYELLVFDNGSCPEMVAYLQGLFAQGKIDRLVLSAQNIGKLNALYRIAQLASGSVIAYSDDDVYHLKGWLPAHLEVLDTFPNVGAVTGFYIRQRVVMSSDSTLAWAKSSADAVERGLRCRASGKWHMDNLDAWKNTKAVAARRTWSFHHGPKFGQRPTLRCWRPKRYRWKCVDAGGGLSDQLMGRMVRWTIK